MQKKLYPETYNFKDEKWFGGEMQGPDKNKGLHHFIDHPEYEAWEQNRGTRNDINWAQDAVSYNINSLGYRGVEPQQGMPAAFGCSFTFGYAVDEPETWPALLGLANFGEAGTSNDRIVRNAITYINSYSPKDIYVMLTFSNRREWVTEGGEFRKFKGLTDQEHQRIIKQNSLSWESAHMLLQNDQADHYNYFKNKLFLQTYCENKNVNLHITHVGALDWQSYIPARDLQHPGAMWHLIVAEQYKTS
jgi:hypothetical protein